MLIEIHIIQNHSPSNLNRDDLGAPKTCVFGGVTRARISSQCLKRSIRRSAAFQQALHKERGIRTRRLPSEIARRAHDQEDPPPEWIDRVRKAFETLGVTFNVDGDPYATDIIWFVPSSAIDQMAEAVRESKDDLTSLTSRFAHILRDMARAPDIALCGRMTEFKPKDKEYADLPSCLRVEAALSAAHAISTHEVLNEVDYFTAADDLPLGAGAAHVNEAMFASACFYKYFCIDWDQLKANLGGDKDLADLTVQQFLIAAALTNPTGKQTSFAAFNPPDGILVEVKTQQRVPVSYANAFARPVPTDASRGLVGESIAGLGQYVHDVALGYAIPAQRFWFSPNRRYMLTYVDRQDSQQKEEKAVVDDSQVFGALEELVAAVMTAVGNWAQSQPAGAVS